MTQTVDLTALCRDFLDEREALRPLLADLDPQDWRQQTPAPGWTVLDQVAHLAWFDQATATAIKDPEGFRAQRRSVVADIDGFVHDLVEQHRNLTGAQVVAWWDQTGPQLVTAAQSADQSATAAHRIPWYGPDMTVASAITARIMETWAHGQDIADTFGIRRSPTPRLEHIAFLGWRAIPYAFRSHDLPVPDDAVHVELEGCSFGPEGATNVVRGSLLDFCLVVTQRRHPADSDLTTVGPVAKAWLPIAQAFAGPPGAGRRSGQSA
jgi:uncharacterized protein (TIGR03084 family)